MTLEAKIPSIASRGDLAEFIAVLRRDLEEHPDDWENASLNRFLEALGAWVENMDGFYLNCGREVPAQPSWRVIAEMLAAARTYE